MPAQSLVTASTFLALAMSSAASLGVRAPLNGTISSCSSTWMAINDVKTNNGAIQRRGYLTAVNAFCAAADDLTVDAGDYLSMATRVWLDGGDDPSTYGFPGYVYFEVHNKQTNASHQVIEADCVSYLQELSNEGSKCYGSDNVDTKGGTYQILSETVSYHALGEDVVPAQCDQDQLWTDGALSTRSSNGTTSLSPFPLNITYDTVPIFCHSHNDEDQAIPVYNALSVGCISIEADTWLEGDGSLRVSHSDPGESGPTLQSMFLDPLMDLLNTQNPPGSTGPKKGVFQLNSNQPLVLLVDIKSDGTTTFAAVLEAIQPFQAAGYLSHWDGTQFVQGPITVLASGNGPLSSAANDTLNPGHYIFMDGRMDASYVGYNTTNTYYASADFETAVTSSGTAPLSASNLAKVVNQTAAAHALGFVTRYWDIPSTSQYQDLYDNGVDIINVDNLYSMAGITWRFN